jgi:DNA-binding GntR family transcriptional regulator
MKPGTRSRTEEQHGAGPGRVAPLYMKAFHILATQIHGGEIEANARLQETHIAERFGISRAPARQALELLKERGYVTKLPSRGYMVCPDAGSKPLDIDPGLLEEGETRLSNTASWETIYGEVEGEIVSRISLGSWRVNEAELARCYNVSRTVAHDVVARLQQRGVVQQNDRSHWIAPGLTPRHIGELYEMRWVLEPIALIKAAPNIPPAELETAMANLEAAIGDPENTDGAVLDRLEEELHVSLLKHCGNEALLKAITLHQSLLIAHRFLYRRTPHLFGTEPFLPDHHRVLDCLRRGFSGDAAKALEDHLRVSLDRAIARVDDVAQQYRPDHLSYLEMIDSKR